MTNNFIVGRTTSEALPLKRVERVVALTGNLSPQLFFSVLLLPDVMQALVACVLRYFLDQKNVSHCKAYSFRTLAFSNIVQDFVFRNEGQFYAGMENIAYLHYTHEAQTQTPWM